MQTTSVTEFLTGSALANPDFVFIGGSGGSYSFVNRIASNFNGFPLPEVATIGS